VNIGELAAIPRLRPEVARALFCFAERYVGYARLQARHANGGRPVRGSLRDVRRAKADARLALEVFGTMYGDQLVEEETTRALAADLETPS
jgi:hypothetical protein